MKTAGGRSPLPVRSCGREFAGPPGCGRHGPSPGGRGSPGPSARCPRRNCRRTIVGTLAVELEGEALDRDAPADERKQVGDPRSAEPGVGGELEHGANPGFRLVRPDGQIAVEQATDPRNPPGPSPKLVGAVVGERDDRPWGSRGDQVEQIVARSDQEVPGRCGDQRGGSSASFVIAAAALPAAGADRPVVLASTRGARIAQAGLEGAGFVCSRPHQTSRPRPRKTPARERTT